MNCETIATIWLLGNIPIGLIMFFIGRYLGYQDGWGSYEQIKEQKSK